MGISERKARQREGIRQEILSAAEALFVKNGYENVSMRKIAAKIEYSTTTIYRMFKNKSDIMEQLIAQGYVDVYQRYEEIISKKYASPLETLKQIIRSYVDFSLSHPNHYKLWFDTSDIRFEKGHLEMTHGDSKYQVYQPWLDQIEKCQVIQQIGGSTPLSVFQTIWTSVHGLILLRLQYPHFPWMPLEDQVESLLDMIDNGLAPAGKTSATQSRKK